MKFVAIALALLVVVSFASSVNYAYEFANFAKQYNKSYDSAEEAAARFNIFVDNYDMIAAENAKNQGWTLGINEFADLTWDEFKAGHFGYNPAKDWSYGVDLAGLFNVPDSIDWSAKGAVTGIKNQGQCGSCWAFSTTGSTEGAVEIKTGKLTSLSEQQLVDCSRAEGNLGCQGGLMDDAFKYIIKNGGLCSEADYPYKGVGGVCKKTCDIASTISSYQDVAADDEDSLQAAVAMQPVSVAIEADKSGFQFYKSGVFSGTCGTNLDHGVLAVGYGTESSKDYWKVKNSWGASWGMDGYILLARSGGKTKGQCGIAMQPSYPVA
jgi:cathepsin L